MREFVSISLVTPVYNEEKNIGVLLEEAVEIFQKNNIEAEVIVVNDGSTDNTKRICEELSKRYKIIKLINHEVNKGYAQGVSTGITHAKNDFIILVDSDGQFDVNDVTSFLKKHDETGAEVIFGYRKNRKGTFLRKLISFNMTKISNILFGMNFKDTQSAFQFIKSDILKNISIESPSFQVPTEIKIKISSLGHDFEQIPITHRERKGGKASFKALRIIPPTIWFLLCLKWRMTFSKGSVTNVKKCAYIHSFRDTKGNEVVAQSYIKSIPRYWEYCLYVCAIQRKLV